MGRLRNWIADNRAAAIILVAYAILDTAYNLASPLFKPPDELLLCDNDCAVLAGGGDHLRLDPAIVVR